MSQAGPPAAVRTALHRVRLYCPDCSGPAAGLEWHAARGVWVVTLWHDPTCPVLRSAAVRRAVDRVLADLVGAVFFTADYGDDVVGRHRRGPAPVP